MGKPEKAEANAKRNAAFNAWDRLSLTTRDPTIGQHSVNIVHRSPSAVKRKMKQQGEISHQRKEKTWRLKMSSFHLVKKKETPAFPDNGSDSNAPSLCHVNHML